MCKSTLGFFFFFYIIVTLKLKCNHLWLTAAITITAGLIKSNETYKTQNPKKRKDWNKAFNQCGLSCTAVTVWLEKSLKTWYSTECYLWFCSISFDTFFFLEFLYLKLLLKIGFSAAREHWSEHHLYSGCQGNMQMSCQPCSSLPVCLKCTGRKNSYFVKSTIISLPTRFCLYLHLFLLVWCQHSIQEVKTHLDKIFSRLWPNYFFFITLWSGIKNFKLRVFLEGKIKGACGLQKKIK